MSQSIYMILLIIVIMVWREIRFKSTLLSDQRSTMEPLPQDLRQNFNQEFQVLEAKLCQKLPWDLIIMEPHNHP